MSNRPTPETDAENGIEVFDENGQSYISQVVDSDFARKLERERDEARAIAYDLASVASHCLGWHDHESSEAAERIADTLKIWRSTQPCKK